MKILKLIIENLNSIYGRWEIDFTDKHYQENSIFTISGPTGSGKSTILDGICLALYGKTPRLDKINASSNEIMSRLSSFCSAEVLFETSFGKFIASWSQTRSRKKNDGNLQLHKHELSNASTGEIIESKVSKTFKCVEDVTGMDFHRFTRAMLLAQGSFSVFLNANADERSPILEQITGTEIYSTISKKVHEIYSIKKNDYKQLEIELQNYRLLSEEERENYNTNKELIEKEILEISNRIKNNSVFFAKIQEKKKLNSSLLLDYQKLEEIENECTLFEKNKEILSFAERAEKITGVYNSLEKIKINIAENDEKYKILIESIPGLESNIGDKNSMLASLEEETCNFKHEKSDLSIKIKETRIIDQEISNLLNSLKSNDKEISELSNSISQVKKDLENCLENKNKTEKKLSEIELYLNTNILDEEIKGSLSGIEVSISELLKLNNRKKDVEKEILKENEKVDNNLDRLDFLNKNYFKKSELANNEKSKYDEIKKEIEIIESEHNMGELTQKIETVKSIINIFEDFNKVRSTIELNERLIHSIELSLAEANNNFDIVSNNYDRSVIELDLNEKNLDLMTQKQLLEKRVLDFELERAKLVNNLPCPLCGSLVHPFTDGIEIDLNSTKNEIDLLRETIKSSKGIQKKLLSQLNDFKSEIVKFENKKDELLRVLEKDKKYVKDVLEEFKLELLEVESFCNSKKSELDILKKIADNYFYLNSEIVKISEKIGLFDKDLNSELISIEKVKNELDNSQSSINEKNKLLMTLSEQIKTAGDELSLSLSKFNLKIPQNLDFRPLIEDLKSRENLYSFNYKTFLSKKEELNDLMKLESVFNEKVNIFSQDYSKLELNKHNLENTISKKRGERNYLFGNKNCDLVENELIVKEKKYNDSIELIKNEITKLIIQKEKTETLINSISEQIIAMKNSLHSEETLFIEKLKEQNFSNKEHYLRSTRTVEEITNLKNRSLELDEKKLTITNLIEDKNNKLLELNEIDITAEIETNEKIALDENKYSENKENLGRIKHILDEDSRIRKDNDLKMKIFNSMGKDLDDWEALHDLIGSADGKKFRNIAQGITFEQMVIIANQQLRKITDRYILVRSKIEPLDLNVIDNYQAGVVRSTKNLSGGESFLISLSLALGLSYMSGKKSSVDTLFLDEGFGTLDEDTLEIALSALNSIGQNGKLVGIISHVPILKERISTTINVIPKNLGKSLLEGPGVRAN